MVLGGDWSYEGELYLKINSREARETAPEVKDLATSPLS